MESYTIKNLSFAYPNQQKATLNNISITVGKGEFVTVCGKSGCGKTTLLRLLKSCLAPFGKTEGSIYFEGRPLQEYTTREQAASIGFVMQSPDSQLVTDKVWHELAFGLESLGYSTSEIRTRVSEMAAFFGIEQWFYKNVNELSGGQKQLLNLASVMVMQPEVIILDEPTSQLDPIAAGEFFKTLSKINLELGTTVIISEHRLEEAFAVSHRVVVMDNGSIFAEGEPKAVGNALKNSRHYMLASLPAPMRVHAAVPNELACPVTVRDGRMWLEEFAKTHSIDKSAIPAAKVCSKTGDAAIELKDVWFRYQRDGRHIVKGLGVKIQRGEHFAITGGNGAGKTTLLSLISGLNKPERGEILINGVSIFKNKNILGGTVGMLLQNPCALFVKKSVYLDLEDAASDLNLGPEQTAKAIGRVCALCRIENLLERHPFDLSGGEQQRAALAKVLVKNPQILLLDEPTKGMDAHFKAEFASILQDLKKSGVTVVTVSHDIEFCARYADRCALMFDGDFTSVGTPRSFFAGNSFYTTAANRMARSVIPEAVVTEDIIAVCGGQVPPQPCRANTDFSEIKLPQVQKQHCSKPSPAKITAGIIFAVLFAVTLWISSAESVILFENKALNSTVIQLLQVAQLTVALVCLLPKRSFEIPVAVPKKPKLSKAVAVQAVACFVTVPLTVYFGTYFFGTKKYYFISLLVIIQTLIPFFMMFESRRPKAGELVIISVLCGIAVAGRSAFFMLPQFKPLVALVIIAGVCFGGETGFVVGAVSGFVSNFFFGQGPWTPWQMFALGIIGFVSGVLFAGGFIRRTKGVLCIFGMVITLVLYGIIMNSASVIIMQPEPSIKMLVAAFAAGLPMDVIHAASTGFFMYFLSEPMIQRLERVKTKYGFVI